LETIFAPIKTEVHKIGVEQGVLEKRVDKLSDEVGEHTFELDEHEVRITELEARIPPVGAPSLADRVKALEGLTGKLQHAIWDVESYAKRLENLISGIDKRLRIWDEWNEKYGIHGNLINLLVAGTLGDSKVLKTGDMCETQGSFRPVNGSDQYVYYRCKFTQLV